MVAASYTASYNQHGTPLADLPTICLTVARRSAAPSSSRRSPSTESWESAGFIVTIWRTYSARNAKDLCTMNDDRPDPLTDHALLGYPAAPWWLRAFGYLLSHLRTGVDT